MGTTHDIDHGRDRVRDASRAPRRRLGGRAAFAGIAAVALVAGACAGDDDAAGDATGDAAVDETLDRAQATEETLAATAAPSESDSTSGGAAGGSITDVGGFDLDALGRDLAIELRVVMTSDDLRATVEGIRRAAVVNGGGVVSSDVDFGTEAAEPDDAPTGRATLVVKVPPSGLDAVLGGLDRLGTVTSIGQDAEDVTDRLVDLDVRIRNQRESVDRVRELLAAATDLDQVVRLESELTAREVELERLLATQQQLQDRVALSTLTIDVVPADPSTAAPEPDDGIGDAFRGGWDAFVTVLFGIGFVLAVLAPFLAVALVAVIVAWIAVRSRGSRRPVRPRSDADTLSEDPVADASPRV